MSLDLLLSADSFVAALVVAPLLSNRQAWRFSALLGLLDMAASLASMQVAVPGAVIVALAWVMIGGIGVVGAQGNRLGIWLLPLLCSIDNLTGCPDGWHAATGGLASMALALCGFWFQRRASYRYRLAV